MTDEVVAPDPAVIEQNTSGVVWVLAETLARHSLNGAYCLGCDWQVPSMLSSWEDQHRLHQASVVAALPNIAIVPTSGSIEVITHAQNGDLIAREIGTSRHIAIAHIGSQPHSFANAPEALALKAEGYAALAARAAGGQA